MKYFSTFSGIGGFELGITQAYELCNVDGSKNRGGKKNKERNQRAGFFTEKRKKTSAKERPISECNNYEPYEGPLCVGFSEVDKYAVQIYKKQFPTHKNYGDITKINAEEVPDFELLVGGFPCQSFSIAGKRGGFNDTRGTLFFEIARIVKQKQPRLLLLENVKGLLSHDKGKTFLTIISALDELGYDCQWQVLNSKNHGVPQTRERVFIIGHLRGTCRPEVFPFGESAKCHNNRAIITGTLTARYPASQREGAYIEEKRHEKRAIRKLTPKECERLQGFPDGWTEGISDTQRYKCLGNAVTVNVIRDICIKLLF